jgi:hypothetical protein
MLTRILKYLILTGLIMASNVSFAVAYHDPLNYARAFEILKTAKSQFEEMKRVHDELASTKRLIGNFQQEVGQVKDELTNWRTYYDRIDTLDPEQFSAIKWLRLDDRLPIVNSLQALEDVKRKLFDNKSEQMEFDRQQMARNAIASGIVTSGSSKKSLGESKKKIIAVTDSALETADLLSAIKNQNKLLGIIASEMVQNRTIQAQQLELLAAFFSQFEGTGQLSDPARLPAKKNTWQ